MSPNVVTEFYPAADGGWAVVHWGTKFPNVTGSYTVEAARTVMSMGHGSFVFYMGVGGTSSGWWSGSNCVMSTSPGWPQCNETTPPQYDITSYDMVAPISESGQHGVGAHGEDLFEQIRELLGPLQSAPLPLEPPPLPRAAYGAVAMSQSLAVLDYDVLAALTSVSATSSSTEPPLMEAVPCLYGMALYRASLPTAGSAFRTLRAVVRDRATVFIDGRRQPLALYRGVNTSMKLLPPSLPPEAGSSMGTIEMLIENLGRVNYGRGMINETKGVSSVLLDDQPIRGGWNVSCLPFGKDQLQALPWSQSTVGLFGKVGSAAGTFAPRLFKGMLTVPVGKLADTWLSTRGWGKGSAFVNGNNIGRYWERQGPQHALYVPAPLLREGLNEIVMLELEQPRSNEADATTVDFIDHADFEGAPLKTDDANHLEFTLPTPAELATVKDRLTLQVRSNTTAAAAAQFAASLLPNGTWPDIDYADKTRGAWKTDAHLSRVESMAQALAASSTSGGEKNAVLLNATVSALGLWLEKDFRNPNWWFGKKNKTQRSRLTLPFYAFS